MSNATFTLKAVHVAIKRDNGIEYLMKRFDFAQEEDLFNAIRKISPYRAEEMIRKLEKKKKSSDRQREKDSDKTMSVHEYEQETTIEEQPVQKKEIDGMTSESKEILEDLCKEEKELSSYVCALEVRHNLIADKRRTLLESLQNAQKALKELRKILEVQSKNVVDLYNSYNLLAEEMKKLTEERNVGKALLDEVRKQIAVSKRISILVYQNGEMEVENGELPNTEEAMVREEFSILVNHQDAGDLTLNEVKKLATLRVVSKMKEEEGGVQVLFENSKLQDFWNSLS